MLIRKCSLFETQNLNLVSWLEYHGYRLLKHRFKKGVAVFSYEADPVVLDAVNNYFLGKGTAKPRELLEALRKITSWSKKRENKGVFYSRWVCPLRGKKLIPLGGDSYEVKASPRVASKGTAN